MRLVRGQRDSPRETVFGSKIENKTKTSHCAALFVWLTISNLLDV